MIGICQLTRLSVFLILIRGSVVAAAFSSSFRHRRIFIVKTSSIGRSLSRPLPVILLQATVDSFSEIVVDDDDEDANEWVPDREQAQRKRLSSRIRVEHVASSSKDTTTSTATPPRLDDDSGLDSSSTTISSPYTDEEEDVIAAMGGKTFHRNRKREEGFLGDSTLEEIAQDYAIPICYIADVLCIWGVSPPINPKDRLGDLVTGEQAFALVEAVNSLDVAQVQGRYSNQSLLTICYEWNIDLQTAFEFAIKEGWSLPFGVQTCLRVEQEDELLRVYGSI